MIPKTFRRLSRQDDPRATSAMVERLELARQQLTLEKLSQLEQNEQIKEQQTERERVWKELLASRPQMSRGQGQSLQSSIQVSNHF
jgi:hypothetical protein